MTTPDLLILLVFILYTLIVGFRARSIASQNLEEYFLAGRSLKGWQAGISMAATQFAADTPLLVTGLIATAGIFALWRLWIYAIAFLLLGFLLAPCWRRVGVLTDAELSEIRYGSQAAPLLRGIKAVYFGTIINCTVLAMVLLAATRLAEPFLLWHEWLPPFLYETLRHTVEWLGVSFSLSDTSPEYLWILSTNNLLSIGTLVLVTLLYSTTGGLRSVVATDLVQFFIAIAGSLLFGWYVLQEVGGLDGLSRQLTSMYTPIGPGGLTYEQLVAFTPSEAKHASFAILLAYGLQWLLQMNADGTGYLAQRSMACRSDRDAMQAAVIFTFSQIVVRSLIWIPIGLGLLLIFPPDPHTVSLNYAAEREFMFIQGIAELLPNGLRGLLLVGMLAALASTLDTHLNWGASYWTHDIYQRFICPLWLKKTPSQRSLVWIARGANLLILLLALFILPFLSSIQKAWQISLLLGSGIGVTLVLRWIWWRLNAWGELASLTTSLLLAPALLWSAESRLDESMRLLIMAGGATLMSITISLLTKPENPGLLRRFYRKASPPGFWGPVAIDCGLSPQESMTRLWNALLATFLAALSVFLILTGIGSFIAHSPSPAWFPWSEGWIPGVLLTGFGLIPLWWRLAFRMPSHAIEDKTIG
ncbi:MAG: Na+:solute symporter [Nitrospirales bacterium]|nr:Na+:solute symporter [Nitrospira sp.]MDR4499880.1 Na+:solute symporter [Nitrospirales bacterium]